MPHKPRRKISAPPLAEGTEFEMIDRRSDWLLIRLTGDQEGWIPDRAAAVY